MKKIANIFKTAARELEPDFSRLRAWRSNHYATTPRRHDATTPRRHDATTSRRHDATTQRRHYATTPRRHDATTPRRHYAITPRRHYATAPLRHYATAPLLIFLHKMSRFPACTCQRQRISPNLDYSWRLQPLCRTGEHIKVDPTTLSLDDATCKVQGYFYYAN